MKVLGRGAGHFFGDAFNRFDFLIVSLAVVETVAVAMTGGYDPSSNADSNSNSNDSNDGEPVSALRGLKVLRAFRVFKMFRYVSSLRVIGEVLLSSLSSFTSIAALLCLFTVVFAILGLHVFGGTNTDPANAFAYGVDDPSLGGRASFDTFYHSLLAVFQVLTLEDWEFIMFKSVKYAGWSASVFFVSWVIVGKYTFLTLFLAVTMEAFESKYDARAGEEARAVAELVKKKRARRRRRFAELRRRKKEKERRKQRDVEDDVEKQTTTTGEGLTGQGLALMTTTVSVTGGERTERRSDAEGKQAPVSFLPEASSGGDVLKNADDDDGSVVAESRVADDGCRYTGTRVTTSSSAAAGSASEDCMAPSTWTQLR